MKAFSFVFSLHNRILYNSDVRCSLLREVACSIVWLRVTKWSDNRILYGAIRKWQGILGYPSSKPGLLFEYVLDIIISPLNSKFDRFSPILVREKKITWALTSSRWLYAIVRHQYLLLVLLVRFALFFFFFSRLQDY